MKIGTYWKGKMCSKCTSIHTFIYEMKFCQNTLFCGDWYSHIHSRSMMRSLSFRLTRSPFQKWEKKKYNGVIWFLEDQLIFEVTFSIALYYLSTVMTVESAMAQITGNYRAPETTDLSGTNMCQGEQYWELLKVLPSMCCRNNNKGTSINDVQF